MPALRARVVNGRLILDEPTTLPEGTVLDLVLDDEGDDLSPQDLMVRDEAILSGWESAKLGRGRPAEDVLRDLRKPK